jgi:S-DNA-T family DNA segregation ATPase FtsK/SpoIIIE
VNLRLTVVNPMAGRAVEVRVAARRGATFAELLDALDAAHALTDTSRTWSVDSVGVPPTATLGLPPLLDGARLMIRPAGSTSPDTSTASAASGLLQLHAVGGPDTGLVHDLPPGRHVLGRGANTPIRVGDSSLSRLHAELTVAGRSITVRDLESTNGTWVNGIPVGGEPITLAAGATLQTGDSRWQLRTPATVSAATRPDHEGHLLVSRSPRLPLPGPAAPIPFPEEPNPPAGQRLPIAAATLPLVFSAVLAVVMQSPMMLLFGLMGPLLLLGSWWSDRRNGKRVTRAEQRRYAAALATAQALLAAALAAERDVRLAEDPDPAWLAGLARGPLTGLWDRTGDPALRVRIGLGTVGATQSVAGSPHPPRVDEVPVVVRLDGAAATGIIGPREETLRLARWMIGQLALRYSPADLSIGLLAPESEREWSWVAELPHSQAEAERDASRGRGVILVDGTPAPAPVENVHVLAVAADAADLPSACTQIVDLRAGSPSLTWAQQPVAGLDPDGVPRAWALLLAQRLGPLRDAAAIPHQSVIPSRTTLLDVLGIPERDGIPDLTARWRESPRSTLTPIGATASGPLPIDLVRDGPHALVGGTTGSGKSELLVSLVAGLAAANRPDELSFVLVDYKGGAAFGACRDLPHVVGLVTDLDHQLTERALVSLDAELKRRERVFGEHGVADLAAYQGVCRPGDPTVGRLVIVVDEFRSLAEELPDFVTGLVRVASLGRSLGVHLVIATQRPGGVVTADMRANLGLRIALRVRDIVDSLDVVESPVAASIAESTPGRAILTSAATRLVEVQTALATGPSRRAVEPPLRVVSIDGLAVPLATHSLDGPTQVDDLVAASRRAVLELAIPLPGSPWLPPLSGDLTVASLAGGSGWPVPLGRRDVPLHQRQSDWTWDPLHEGHLGIVGAPRTGRTTALHTVAAQLAARFSPDEIHLYAVHAGSLGHLSALPHVGASVRCDELPRLAQLLTILTDPSTSSDTMRVLLVDDWDRVCEELDRARAGVLRDRLTALLRRGPRERLALCLTGGRASLSGSIGQLVPRRLLLLPAEPVDLAMAGLSAKAVPQHPAPGRGIDLADGSEVQLASVVAEPTAVRCTAYLQNVARNLPPRQGDSQAITVPTLPETATLNGLARRPDVLVVGTDGRDAVGFEPERGERRIAVLGSRSSGRTTALQTLAAGLIHAGHRVALIASGPGRDAGPSTFGIDDVDALVALRQAHPDLAVLVDDAERVADSKLDAVLREIVRLVDEDCGLVIVASTVTDVLRNPRSLAAQVAGPGVGLLLGKNAPGDEAALGLRGTLWEEDQPGRAHLVRAGQATPIQVASA